MKQAKKPNGKPLKWSYRIAIVIVSLFAFWSVCFWLMDLDVKTDFKPGATFSVPYAQELGLDPMEVLNASLDDLKIRYFRIPAYWSLLQPKNDGFDWTVLDRQLDAIASRGGKVTLAIGQKLPRWPECWMPDWVMQLSETERETALKRYLTATVERYKNHPAVDMWQVENEAHFPFGTCPAYRSDLLDEELALVRALDNTKPIATTDSGELSFWSIGRKVDQLGTSVYRVVVSPVGVFRYWFLPPQLYLRKAQILGWLMGFKHVYVSEFQMEPWVKTTIPQSTLEEQSKTMDLKQFNDNIRFAKRMGMERVDFWGVEWWYWLKTKLDMPQYWEGAKTLYANP